MNKLNMLFLIGVLFFCFTSETIFAQGSDLYVPLNIQKAYENGTRSSDGNPGSNYWQNRSDYTMKVELVPDSSLIVGEGQIVYHNNSPDTLKRIVFRLYQDIFKEGNARQFQVNLTDLTSGTDIKYLIIDGDSVNVKNNNSKVRRTPTNLIVRLNNPIPPNHTVNVESGWKFHVPVKTQVRMGQYSPTGFFIAYWYPQIAVYDDIDGWDTLEYLGNVEFYNDFGNFDVDITVPGDYLIWATGVLQNPNEVLKDEIVKRYKKAQSSDDVVRIITPKDYENGNVTQQNEKNVWHFKANYVSDFSFAASNHCNWDGASVIVDDQTKRRVLTDAVYPDSTPHFEEAAMFSRATIEYLSKELPGIPYPYPHITSFCNGSRGGGMETPMMTNDGAPKERSHTISLIFHEIAHSYFPFYMGINERKYAWMDEGWASFFPREVTERLAPEYDYQKNLVQGYVRMAGQEVEMPMMVPTFLLDYRPTMRTAAYSRPAVAYNMLKDILGKEKFKTALQDYIKRWNGKHPIPLDFFNSIENSSGENLSWFWRPWFYETGYPDLGIKTAKDTKNGTKVTIEKVGKLPVPVELSFVFDDSSKQNIYKSASVWKNGDKEITVDFNHKKRLLKIELGSPYITDVNNSNNVFPLDSFK